MAVLRSYLGWTALAVGITTLLASATPAHADGAVLMLASQYTNDTDGQQLTLQWPNLPADRSPSFEDQLTQRISDFGNSVGDHLDSLSHEMFKLRVDARHRNARLQLGGGSVEHLRLRLDSDIHFDDADAHIHTHVDLAYHGHTLEFYLPEFQVCPTEYRGDYGIAIKLPLFVHKF